MKFSATKMTLTFLSCLIIITKRHGLRLHSSVQIRYHTDLFEMVYQNTYNNNSTCTIKDFEVVVCEPPKAVD